jgi:uroporphyrinogen-III synthase
MPAKSWPIAAAPISSRQAEPMRLLVTRPAPDAGDTATRLRALGHEPLVAPLLRIVFTPPPVDIAEPAAILVTSRNGVRALATWPQAQHWGGKPVFGTGRATVAEARRAGFTDVRSGNGDSADLSNFFMLHVDRALRPILYPAARDRAGALSSGLRANGFDLVTIEAYRAEAASALDEAVVSALRARTLDGVLLYSRRTAEVFAALMDRDGLWPSVKDVPLYALSPRVAEPLLEFSGALFVAKHPNEDSLFALLSAA